MASLGSYRQTIPMEMTSILGGGRRRRQSLPPTEAGSGVFRDLSGGQIADSILLGGFLGVGGGMSSRAQQLRAERYLGPFREALRAEYDDPMTDQVRRTELLGMLADTERTSAPTYERLEYDSAPQPRAPRQYERQRYSMLGGVPHSERLYAYEQPGGEAPDPKDESLWESSGTYPLHKATRGRADENRGRKAAEGLRALMRKWSGNPMQMQRVFRELPASIWRDALMYDPGIIQDVYGGRPGGAPAAATGPADVDALLDSMLGK